MTPKTSSKPRRAAACPSLLLAAMLALGLAPAWGQAPGTAAAASATPGAAPSAGASAAATRVSRHDRSFVTDAATDGLAEVALGRLAQERAASAEVKAYGAQMVADHGQANEELAALARGLGLSVPDKPTNAQQRMHDGLAKLQGAEFDRLYMAHMAGDHRKAVKLFQEQAKAGDDPSLKAFAQKTLPTLQAHLQKANAIHDSVKGAKR